MKRNIPVEQTIDVAPDSSPPVPHDSSVSWSNKCSSKSSAKRGTSDNSMSADSPASRQSGGTQRSTVCNFTAFNFFAIFSFLPILQKSKASHTTTVINVQPQQQIQTSSLQQPPQQQNFLEASQFVSTIPVQPMIASLPSAILSPLPVTVSVLYCFEQMYENVV